MTTKLRLRRADGRLYLTRRGWSTDDLFEKNDEPHLLGKLGLRKRSWFGIYIHHITAPDPGPDLHDHPWPFVSLIVKGWYAQIRADSNVACDVAWQVQDSIGLRGSPHHTIDNLRRWNFNRIPLDRCHMIFDCAPDTWSIVFRGPRRRRRHGDEYWGFYTPTGYVPEGTYERLGARDLWNEAE